MRTGNPALNKRAFERSYSEEGSGMTIQGTVNKSFLMIALIFAVAFYSWFNIPKEHMQIALIGSVIGGLIFALITIFVRKAAPYTTPVYVILEGVFLGVLSGIMEQMFPGIVLQAVLLTFGVLLSLLLAYKAKLIRATENFKLGVFAATGGIALIYMITFVLGFFGRTIPYIHESGPIGIGFSVIVVIIAALNLVLDFDFIEKGAENKAPKYMEWYATFGLMVTLIWLYIEILRLLAKIRSR